MQSAERWSGKHRPFGGQKGVRGGREAMTKESRGVWPQPRSWGLHVGDLARIGLVRFDRLLPERSPSPVYGAGLLNRLGC